VAILFTASGCFRGGGRLLGAVLASSIITAAIVSSHAPPPPRVVYMPPAQPGYSWQPGYWALDGDEWVWVGGRWVAAYPGYAWQPTHWENDPGGQWRLAPGHWVQAPEQQAVPPQGPPTAPPPAPPAAP
jgi:hypothetical protein